MLTILLPGNYQRLKTLLAHTLFKVGSKFGYYPEVVKLWLIFKEDFKEKADRDSSVKITSTGRRHFGTVTGKISFKEEYLCEKINNILRSCEIYVKLLNSNHK